MEWTKTPELLHLNFDGKPVFNAVLSAVGGIRPEVHTESIDDGVDHVLLRWRLPASTPVDDLSLDCIFDTPPDSWWAPHLAPEPGHCIAQHVFRSPALIASFPGYHCSIVPDLTRCGADPRLPWYLDLDAPRRCATLGMSLTEVVNHIGFRKIPGMILPAGVLELAFFVLIQEDTASPPNPWRKTADFLWLRHGRPLLEAGQPGSVLLDRYVERTYAWAFDSWKDMVWQEFTIGGQRAGAPCFIVLATQSPNYEGDYTHREPLSIWNQAWFSSLRSASGTFRYARRTGNSALMEKARLTKALALAAPMENGLFPSVYRTEMDSVMKDGKEIMSSRGWDTGYWTNSDRCPRNYGVDPSWFHVLDASWTCLLMLRWHEELERDQALLDYAMAYGNRLLTLQDPEGFFPGWLHPQTQTPAPVMNQTPETALSVSFLLKLAELTGGKYYRQAALRAMDALLVEVVPQGRWEDYETYWSCSPYGQDHLLGSRAARNALYKQNSLSIFWTAEALLAAYRATRQDHYLQWGIRCLDELSMYQQVWQPPFIHVPALGGFGVMNYDGEWNDARQSLFAELYLDYYRETGHAPFFERGTGALKAAFVMMYCPENPQVKDLWETVWTFFGPEDYGFTMENYGHDGVVSRDGKGIGPFTIFDWGNGAATEARNRIRDHYGDVYLDRKRMQGFGIDGVQVEVSGAVFVLTGKADSPRSIRVVFEDRSAQDFDLTQRIEIPAGVPG